MGTLNETKLLKGNRIMYGIDIFIGWISGFYFIPAFLFIRESKSINLVWTKIVIGLMLITGEK